MAICTFGDSDLGMNLMHYKGQLGGQDEASIDCLFWWKGVGTIACVTSCEAETMQAAVFLEGKGPLMYHMTCESIRHLH